MFFPGSQPSVKVKKSLKERIVEKEAKRRADIEAKRKAVRIIDYAEGVQINTMRANGRGRHLCKIANYIAVCTYFSRILSQIEQRILIV